MILNVLGAILQIDRKFRDTNLTFDRLNGANMDMG